MCYGSGDGGCLRTDFDGGNAAFRIFDVDLQNLFEFLRGFKQSESGELDLPDEDHADEAVGRDGCFDIEIGVVVDDDFEHVPGIDCVGRLGLLCEAAEIGELLRPVCVGDTCFINNGVAGFREEGKLAVVCREAVVAACEEKRGSGDEKRVEKFHGHPFCSMSLDGLPMMTA